MLLSACDQMDTFRAGPEPAPPSPVIVEEISPVSRELMAYYARVEQGHRTRGLLRIDGGGPDVPYDADRLARTFTSTAFSREFTDVGRELVRREGDSILHRWGGPVLVEPIFGASVPRSTARPMTPLQSSLCRTAGPGHPTPVSALPRRVEISGCWCSPKKNAASSGPTLRRLIPEHPRSRDRSDPEPRSRNLLRCCRVGPEGRRCADARCRRDPR